MNGIVSIYLYILADFMSNVFIDPIYQKCFDVPQMTNEIASQIVIIKRFLDYLMVGIPQEVRGGLNEFTSFFVQIIDVSLSFIYIYSLE